jgi:hypothetical protein
VPFLATRRFHTRKPEEGGSDNVYSVPLCSTNPVPNVVCMLCESWSYRIDTNAYMWNKRI